MPRVFLRMENVELFKENKALKDELEATQKLLADVRKSAKDQADRDAESIRVLQDNNELLSKYSIFVLFAYSKFCWLIHSLCQQATLSPMLLQMRTEES